MMGKYHRIRADLVKALEEDDTSFPMNKTAVFKKKAEKVTGCFGNINVVATSLQTRLYKLKNTRADLDALLAKSENGHTNENNCWYQRQMSGTYIKPGSPKLPNPHFVSGVIKLQNNKILQLTPDEKEKDACVRLVNQDQVEGEEGDGVSFA